MHRLLFLIHLLVATSLSLQIFATKGLFDEKIRDILGSHVLKEYLINLADQPDEYCAREVEKIKQKKMSVKEFIQLGMQEQLKNSALKVDRIDWQETTPIQVEEFFKELQSIQTITQSHNAFVSFHPEKDFTEEQKNVIRKIHAESAYLRKVPTTITTEPLEARQTSQVTFKIRCYRTMDTLTKREFNMLRIHIFVNENILKNTDGYGLSILEGGIRHEFSHARTWAENELAEMSLHKRSSSLMTKLWYGEKKTNHFKRACEYQADQLPAAESAQAAASIEFVLRWLAQSSNEVTLDALAKKNPTAARLARSLCRLLGDKNNTHPSFKKRIACIVAIKKLLIAEDNLATKRSFLGKIF
jgi:hypothetical protein